jgi:hypothetical protein
VILRNPVTTFIGRVSYGMYLIHIYAFVVILRLARHFRGAEWMPGIGTALVATLFTVGLAAVSWHFFETPVLRLKDRYFRSTPRQKSLERALLTTEGVGDAEPAAPHSVAPFLSPSLRSESIGLRQIAPAYMPTPQSTSGSSSPE